MDFNKPVSEMIPGNEVEGFYVLKNAVSKTTTSGRPFLSASIGDKTGNIELKVWDYSGPVGANNIGSVVKVRGEVSEYRGALQFTAGRIRCANEKDNYDLSLLLPVAPISVDDTIRSIEELVGSITDSDYRQIAEEMLSKHIDSFIKIPAGKSVHHSFISGLLMHTSNMLKIADFMSVMYPQVIDRSLLLTGTLLHDMAKEREFVLSELGMVTDYSVAGQLLGHLVMASSEVGELGNRLSLPENKIMLLQHLLLSHHGEPEFGAAVKPMCAEAELLSQIDMLDSRMEIYSETLAEVPIGSFSNRIFALDKKLYRHF